jgi:hypothetical protein
MIAACASLLLQIMDQLIGRSALPSCMSVVLIDKIAIVFLAEVEVVATVGAVNLLEPEGHR